MFTLLQVELKKVFKKKSIYIIWGLMFIFCLLNNILYWKDYDENGNYKYLDQENLKEEQITLEQELSQYNQEDPKEVSMYISIKTKLDLLTLKQKFSVDSWQYRKVSNYLYDVVYQMNYFSYFFKNDEQLVKVKEEYQKLIDKLKQDDYRYFLDIELQKNMDMLKSLEEQYLQEQDELLKKELETEIRNYQFNLVILNYRLTNQIKEDNSYLNIALESYQENYKTVEYYERLNHIKTYQEKRDYQKALEASKISQYIIETHQNINQENNLSYQLRTIVSDYEIFFVILICIICSSIICDEFKDGTIKLLLIKPYSRGKILLSKYLTSIVVVFLSIFILILMQLFIGGVIFTFDSLRMPVIIYDFNQSKLVEYSIFEYMMIGIMAKVPFLLVLISISMFLGVLSNSVIISMALPLMLYMFGPTFVYFAKQYQLSFMKYLVNINWNLEDYLFGRLPELSFINSKFSCLVLLGHFIVLWILTFSIFKKKNIKNI